MFELVIIAIIAVVALGIYFAIHKASEAKVFAKLDALNATAVSHSTTLSSIETKLASHGVSLDSMHAALDTLEDKAKNAITDVEKSAAIQDLEASIDKAIAIRSALTAPAGTSTGIAPAAAA